MSESFIHFDDAMLVTADIYRLAKIIGIRLAPGGEEEVGTSMTSFASRTAQAAIWAQPAVYLH